MLVKKKLALIFCQPYREILFLWMRKYCSCFFRLLEKDVEFKIIFLNMHISFREISYEWNLLLIQKKTLVLFPIEQNIFNASKRYKKVLLLRESLKSGHQKNIFKNFFNKAFLMVSSYVEIYEIALYIINRRKRE